jgi:hypothetical protein
MYAITDYDITFTLRSVYLVTDTAQIKASSDWLRRLNLEYITKFLAPLPEKIAILQKKTHPYALSLSLVGICMYIYIYIYI